MEKLYIDEEYSSMFSYDKLKSGEVLQLSAIAVKDGVEVSRFDMKMRPLGNVWSHEAEKVHLISRKHALIQRDPEIVINEFVEWIESLGDEYWTASGFNCGGDENFLIRMLVDYKLITRFMEKVKPTWHDVLSEVKAKKAYITTQKKKLGELCSHFGISIRAHDAIEDCIGTWKLDEVLSQIKLPNESHVNLNLNGMTKKKKIERFINMKYYERGSDGCIYLSKYAVNNPEAMEVILSHLWDKHCS